MINYQAYSYQTRRQEIYAHEVIDVSDPEVEIDSLSNLPRIYRFSIAELRHYKDRKPKGQDQKLAELLRTYWCKGSTGSVTWPAATGD